ncbi:protein of unknown function [Chitinophaga jiangningensis]|uniref:DUF4407 domain-containing protein n=1 Tax=Chitinophaga jiangningensis TaxID=1419482 RepID=A0A1M7CYL4_9BACT|nr:DUF4407 domain-containing protein [Chitinophaga jiangningensis]SHL72193.1 protein of unknown function [Chitinophaga jiangningensis]
MTTVPDKKMNSENPEPDAITKFLWWLAAADSSILKECRTEKERYRIIGIAVFVTWMFATIAWGYFFSTIVNDDLIILALALFFGFAILSIDRTLIAAMTRSNGNTKWLPVIFRLVLAITIGLFISQPVVLMLFKKDITAQLEISKQDKIDAYKASLVKQNASQLTTLTRDLEKLNKQLSQKEADTKGYKDGYLAETDGTGGSGRIGEQAVARAKKSAWLSSEEELATLRKQLAPDQEALQSQLANMRTADSLKVLAYTETLTDGFLAQTEALHELTASHPPLQQRYRLIVFIITLIEIMPLLSKLLMPRGEYDERLAAATQEAVTASQMEVEKGKELMEYYKERAVSADRELMDYLFEESNAIRRERAADMVNQWRNNAHSPIKEFWLQAKRLFLGRMM